MTNKNTSGRFSIHNISREHFNIRLLVVFVSLIVLISVAFTTFFVRQQSQDLVQNLRDQGTLLAELLSYNVRVGTFSGDTSLLEGPVDSIMEQKDVLSAKVFSLTGSLLISKDNGIGNSYTINNDIIDALRGNGKPIIIERENEFEFWNPVRSTPIMLSDDSLQPSVEVRKKKVGAIGIVRVSLDKTPLKKSIDELIYNGLLITAGFLIGAFIITFIIVKQITTPLERLTDAAIKLGQGEKNVEIEIETNDEIGKLTKAFNNMTDSLRKREREKESLEEQLRHRQKMDAIGTLAGGIAHDFNNILSSVLFKLALAKKDLSSGKDITVRLAELEKVFNRAKGLTQQLLTFSKGGAPVRQATSITEVIKDTVDFSLCGSNVKCIVSLPDELKAVNVDENQISQVINNLIINADQAMPNGGNIWLTGKNVILTDKNPMQLDAGDYVQLKVRDSGIGILEKDKKKIFDPYFTTKQRGVGLGLALTYSIIKKHEGHIEVTSGPNEGTTFTIYLPCTNAEVEEKESNWELPIHGKGRVLLMDDEEIFRHDAIELLSTIGYTVSEAVDGREALAMYKEAKENKTPFDIVIMDLTIPGGMGGEEAIEKLLKYDPSARAIVSSGYSNSPIMANYKEHGFLGVVIKPFKIHELTHLINSNINKA